IGSDDMPGYYRSFTSFAQAADEAGESRVFGGIPFEFDNHAGLQAGRGLGGYNFPNFLLPVATPREALPGGRAGGPPAWGQHPQDSSPESAVLRQGAGRVGRPVP